MNSTCLKSDLFLMFHLCFPPFSASPLWWGHLLAAGASPPGTGRRSREKATSSATPSAIRKSLTEGRTLLRLINALTEQTQKACGHELHARINTKCEKYNFRGGFFLLFLFTCMYQDLFIQYLYILTSINHLSFLDFFYMFAYFFQL